MRRILVMVLHNFFLVPVYWIKLCYHARHAEKYTDEQHYEMIQTIVHRANKGGHVQVDSYGVENLPKEQGFMLYPNHQGLYDTLAIADAFPYPFSVVAKKEVENVPFIKQMLACMQGYCIDRDDIRQSMTVISQVAKDVQQKKKNFIIFAEGTRSRQGNKIGSFKGGSFKCATKAKCPIVPVALINSFLPFDSDSTEKVNVQVHYLPPITYEEYKEMKTTEIAARVEEEIRNTIKNSRIFLSAVR